MRLSTGLLLLLLSAGCTHYDAEVSVPSHWRYGTEEFSYGLQIIDEENCISYAIHHERDGVGSDCKYQVEGNTYLVMGIKSDDSLHEPEYYKYVPEEQILRYIFEEDSETIVFELKEIEN